MIGAIGFGIVAACALLSALLVVRSTNLVRATLWLAVALLVTAALYAMAGASFLAGVQALLYVGGVVTLMIIGVMTTRRHEGLVVAAESTHEGRAAVVALALFGGLAWAIRSTDGLDVAPPPPLATADLGRGLLVDHVLAFEVASLLLLGAIIGAAVIARRRDPGTERKPGLAVPAASARTAGRADAAGGTGQAGEGTP
jgi:NADH:ubiquinone oxidoreductase subunit 6 (subunit J)